MIDTARKQYAQDNLTVFRKDVLDPAIFESLDKIAPHMGWTRQGDKWISPYKLDGTKPKEARRDKSYCTKGSNVAENGGDTIGLFDYACEQLGYAGGFAQQCKDIADYLGIPFELRTGSNVVPINPLRDAVGKLTKDYKDAPLDESLKRYLKGRGFSDEQIQVLPVGYNKGQDRNGILDMLGKGYPLAYIWHDPKGKPVYVSARAGDNTTTPKTMRPKKDKLQHPTLPYIPAPIKGDEVTIVEGELDALSLLACGVEAVAVGGGSGLTKAHLEALTEAGVTSVTLMLDNDDSGRKYTQNAIKLLGEAGVTTYLAKLPEGCKDPNECLGELGKEALLRCNREAVSLAKWIADKVARNHDAGTSKGRRKIGEELQRHSQYFTDPADHTEAYRTIQEVTEGAITADEMRRTLDRESKIANAKKLLEQGKHAEATKVLNAIGQVVERRAGGVFTMDDFLEDCQQDKPTTIPTGYPILNKAGIAYPKGAITIVGGSTGHGKSSYMINSLFRIHERHKCAMITLEEDWKWVVIKLLRLMLKDPQVNGILADSKRQYDALKSLVGRVTKGSLDLPQVQEALIQLEKARENGLLIEYPEQTNVDYLANRIRQLGRQGYEVVFLDYIQLIKPTTKNSQQYLNIKDVARSLTEAAIESGTAVVCGAQLSRNHHKPRPDTEAPDEMQRWHDAMRRGTTLNSLREGSDIGFEANTVLLCYNQQTDNEHADKWFIKADKNRQGISDWIEMSFNKTTLHIDEN